MEVSVAFSWISVDWELIRSVILRITRGYTITNLCLCSGTVLRLRTKGEVYAQGKCWALRGKKRDKTSILI